MNAERFSDVRRLVGVRCPVPSASGVMSASDVLQVSDVPSASDIMSVSDVLSHREGEPPFPPSLRGYETSRPLRHVACGH